MASLTRQDFEETGALETDSEGIVDHMRSVEGTKVAVLVRELLADDRHGRRKVSLRATDGTVDVSVIARALGGGGHRQAAGASTELSLDELVSLLREQVAAAAAGLTWAARRGRGGARRDPLRQARGRDLARRRGRACAERSRGA